MDIEQPTTSIQARQPCQYDIWSQRSTKTREKTRAARPMPTEPDLLIYIILQKLTSWAWMANAESLSRTYASLLKECRPGAQPGFGVTQTDRSASRTIAPETSEHPPPPLPAPGAHSNCIDLSQIARSCPKPRKLHIDCVISPPIRERSKQ